MSFEIVSRTAGEQPDKLAVIHNGADIDYRAFACAIGDTVAQLKTHRLPAGGLVIVGIGDLLDCWVTILALQSLGLDTVCINSIDILPSLHVDEAIHLVTTERQARRDGLDSYHGVGVEVICLDSGTYRGERAYTSSDHQGDVATGGHILYTSGTTGSYKKLYAAPELQLPRNRARVEQMGLDADTRCHCGSFGPWTAAGYKVPPSVWLARGCVIFDQRPDWQHHYMSSSLTRGILIPGMVDSLLDYLETRPAPPEPLDITLNVGAGFISARTAERLMTSVSKRLLLGYGSTEVNIVALQGEVSSVDDMHWLTPTGYNDIELIDDNGNPCVPGEEGEIRIRTNDLDFNAYLDDERTTRKVFRNGYFYPGDMATQRADGRIRILGRSVDAINVRGLKLNVAIIEENIQNFLRVPAACLFSNLNNAGEDEVIVMIESPEWPDDSALRHLGKELSQFDRVRFAIAHPFPRTRTGTGKIDRIALRKLAFSKPTT